MTSQNPVLSDPVAGGDAPPAWEVGAIGITLAVAFALFLYLLLCLWPTKTPVSTTVKPVSASATVRLTAVPTPEPVTAPPGSNAGDWYPFVSIFGSAPIPLDSDKRFLLVVVLSAALGSFVQIATSFTTFVGNKKFIRSWIWWYLLRIPIGMALALLFFFAVRGGLFTSVSAADLSPYGTAAVGGLVGMFSKQASDKLQDVFEERIQKQPGSKSSGQVDRPGRQCDKSSSPDAERKSNDRIGKWLRRRLVRFG